MKKFLSILLAVLMVVSLFALASCGNTDGDTKDTSNDTQNNDGADKIETLKMGLGVYSVYGDATSADGDMNGSASVATTAAAILIDKNDKIVKCVFDTVDASVGYSSTGAVVISDEYKTKGELGTAYGMVAYAGAKLEWFEQVDALCNTFEGKTLDEVKAMIVDGYKGNDEVIAAGCTIGIADFIYAIEKAFANVVETNAIKDDVLSLSFVTKQEKAADATEEKDGSCEVVANICAVATQNGKVVAAKSDCAVAKFTFNTAGEFTADTTAEIKTKRELGAAYGMSSYGADLNGDGVVKEWFEQADALDAALVGKTADEISALVVDGYGTADLQTAGCTIAISDMIATAVKAAK